MLLINDIEWKTGGAFHIQLYCKERYVGQFEKGFLGPPPPIDIELIAYGAPIDLIQQIRSEEKFKFTVVQGHLTTVYANYERKFEVLTEDQRFHAYFESETTDVSTESANGGIPSDVAASPCGVGTPDG